MNDPWTERLSEYLDGELTAPDAAALDRHLLECADCRHAMAELRAVVARLRADPVLPSDQPTHHNWRAIEQSIAPSRRRWVWGTAIAAALAAIAIGAGLWRRPAPPGSEPLSVRVLPTDYRQAAADLEAILREQRSRLQPETVRTVEASLATIDSAIAQASRALAADTLNEYITRYLAQLRDTRLAALRDAVALVRQGG
jgi:anti-sigma factor ChrR (cupin superfamily)